MLRVSLIALYVRVEFESLLQRLVIRADWLPIIVQLQGGCVWPITAAEEEILKGCKQTASAATSTNLKVIKRSSPSPSIILFTEYQSWGPRVGGCCVGEKSSLRAHIWPWMLQIPHVE